MSRNTPLDNEIDYSTLPAKIRVLQRLGTPYPAGYDQQAVADAKQQAKGIVTDLKKEDIDVKSDKEIVALIAYLQRLGTDIKVKPEQAAMANAAAAQ